METQKAKEIIKALAEGVNPITGEILEKESCFNEPDIIRALYTAVETLEKLQKRKQKDLPENAGKPWNKEDDEKLREMFNNKVCKKEICEYFKRTTGSISSRLVRIGAIKDANEF